ncbi:lipase family protein [Sneathiella marina]|uniref:Lipase family protein n=1 Tax=Sneathiella marina TaxID=2950108 RepID=A0ABY4VYB9_9PROT|nr:lipase family protein [Sneathiella marina]USG59923.1 lipase family protein [Sneathiella marina]
MTPVEAALCAKIAYLDEGAAAARKLGFSYRAVRRNSHFAWIGRRGALTVIAFRGSAFSRSGSGPYRANMSTDLVPWMGPGLVHEGYHQAMWQLVAALRRERINGENVILTGHSMGAALAVLAARFLLAKRVHAFACPRIGNKVFAKNITSHVRITRYVNRGDFLSRLPFRGSVRRGDRQQTEAYVHAGRAVRLSTFGHGMAAYVSGVSGKKHRYFSTS